MKKIFAIISFILLASATVSRPISQDNRKTVHACLSIAAGLVCMALVDTCFEFVNIREVSDDELLKEFQNASKNGDLHQGIVNRHEKKDSSSNFQAPISIIAGVIASCCTYNFLQKSVQQA